MLHLFLFAGFTVLQIDSQFTARNGQRFQLTANLLPGVVRDFNLLLIYCQWWAEISKYCQFTASGDGQRFQFTANLLPGVGRDFNLLPGVGIYFNLLPIYFQGWAEISIYCQFNARGGQSSIYCQFTARCGQRFQFTAWSGQRFQFTADLLPGVDRDFNLLPIYCQWWAEISIYCQFTDRSGHRFQIVIEDMINYCAKLKEWNMFQIFSCHLISICF